MGLIDKIKLISCSFVFLLLPNYVFADYSGPEICLSDKWGHGDNEIGIRHQDTADTFAKTVKVNILGNIAIMDLENNRVKIYSENGYLLSIIKPKNIKVKYTWPSFIGFDSQNNIYTSNYDKKLQQYNSKGELLWEKEVIVGRIAVQPDDTIIIWGYRPHMKGKESVVQYSPTGQLLKTYKEKPLELGVVKGRSLGGKRYRTTIKYPDMTYTINKIAHKKYVRVCNDLYGIYFRTVQKFNDQGEMTGELVFPEKKKRIKHPAFGGYEAIYEVVEEYGSPVVAPNGDVYTWKRTPDIYSIIKWVWIESRTAPVNLKASAKDGRISLSWQTPKQDANSVKAYEIHRSSDVCGPFNKIKKVKKGVLHYTDKEVKEGETYYYQVCAERGSGYSGYSNKAIGSIKE